ncbi:MAG: hypothetical protein JWO04_3651 [Gammaproteobacteria bacterium]|nr:hypothetical protein [Gammaproteobacteria bacterium]
MTTLYVREGAEFREAGAAVDWGRLISVLR